MKLPHARALLPRVTNQVGIEGLFCLECRIDAFCRNDFLTLEGKNKRGILPVENDDIDLIAEIAFTVDDVRCRSLILLKDFTRELGWIKAAVGDGSARPKKPKRRDGVERSGEAK